MHQRQPTTMKEPELTIHGLPKWTLDTIPEEWKKPIVDHQYIKHWKMCQTCHQREGGYSCAACGNLEYRVSRVRYCSRACQRKGWKLHQNDCQHARNISMMGDKQLEDDGVLLRLKYALRWIWVLKASESFYWVVKQAYKDNHFQDPSRWRLLIHIRNFDGKDNRSPLRPTHFEWVPYAPTTNDVPMPAPLRDSKRLVTHFSVLFDGIPQYQGPALLVDDKPEDDPVPYWPWMFTQISLMGDVSEVICKTRLSMLYRAVKDASAKKLKELDEFAGPKPTRRIVVTDASLDSWMRLMYPVTSAIKSRFRTPSKILSRRYRHLT